MTANVALTEGVKLAAAQKLKSHSCCERKHSFYLGGQEKGGGGGGLLNVDYS